MSLKRTLGFGNRSDDPEERLTRAQRTGTELVRVGLVLMVLVVVGFFVAFTKSLPWQRSFELNAVFANAVDIAPNSPVRVAGINVGKVSGITRAPGSKLTEVSMKLGDSAPPIKADAQLKIRSRLFLEGNYFVDLKPGSPSAPVLASGSMIPVAQTATSVQLDEVLTALQADSRQDLRATLRGLAKGFDSGTNNQAAASQSQDTTGQDTTGSQPSTSAASSQSSGQQLSGAAAINESFGNLKPALKHGAQVAQALLGQQPNDLSKMIKGLQLTVSALDQNEQQLKDLVSNFASVNAALASESSSLSAAVRQLPGTLAAARSSLGNLNRSLPATSKFAHDIDPGIKEIPATVDASPAWLAQVNALLGPAELGALAPVLSSSVQNLAKLSGQSEALLDQTNQTSVCANNVILPTVKQKVQDPPNSSDTETYKEFFYALTGIGGAIQNFDGNGPMVAAATGGGNETVSLGKSGGVGGEVFANVSSKHPPLGQRPQLPNPLKRQPYRPEVECSTQKQPDLNSAQTGAPPKIVATDSAATSISSTPGPAATTGGK